MTHRLSSVRDVSGPDRDPFNRRLTAPTAILSSQPCYWQAQRGQFVADGQKLTSVSQEFVLVPVGTDIQSQDRITGITDRRGRVLNGDTLRVMVVVPREDHLEISLEVYS